MLPEKVLAQFKLENGDLLGAPVDLPISINVDALQELYIILSNTEKEITESLLQTLEETSFEAEKVLDIVCQPHAAFQVKAVTRCTSTLPGHAEPVICASFSPNGQHLASGSGDKTVRFWDVNTETPHFTCKGHIHWVLSIAWSPDGKKLASGCRAGQIIIWNPKTGKQIGNTLLGHKQWINSLCWEPYHLNSATRRLASASKDSDVRIWDTVLGNTLFVLSGHTLSVTCVRWGSKGLLYTGSQDRTIKVWRTEDIQEEMLVSGSDDFTLFLWLADKDKKPIARMTGHQQLVNDVRFSPDGRILASASYDRSIKLWDGKSGKFIASLRGHVQEVYQISWSADSRLLVSASADSTLKGHADEVYAVDWSPDGQRVVSGGKDKVLKIWRQ